MSKVRKLLDMAMEFGDAPDVVHPHHKQALATGQHSLGQNPAFPAHGGQGPNPHERLASGTYKNIIDKIRRFRGVVPTNRQNAAAVAQDMFRTLQQIQAGEQQHEAELEPLAVETVMRLPEFKSLRAAVASGELKIEPHLAERVDVGAAGAETSDEEQPAMPDAEVPEIKAQYDELVHRRRLTNTMIQGTAVANNYAFIEHSFNELHDTVPGLANLYGKLMAYIELGYFIQSPEIMQAAAQAGGTESQGGHERLRREEDGSITIVAHGITFPILVQEIVKGCMEYLSISEEEDEDTMHAVRQHADFIDDEQVQMQVGPDLYRQFLAALGQGNEDLMPYVYDALNKLPTAEYNRVMQGLMSGTPQGKAWFSQQARQIRQQLGDEQTESMAKKIIGS